MLLLVLHGVYLVFGHLQGWSFHHLPAQPVAVLSHIYWEILSPVPREDSLQRKLRLSPLVFLLCISAAVFSTTTQRAAADTSQILSSELEKAAPAASPHAGRPQAPTPSQADPGSCRSGLSHGHVLPTQHRCR